MYRYSLIWEKTRAGGFLNANRMPLQSHEDIAVFYNKLPTYNPQKVKGEPYFKKQVHNGDGGNFGKFERIGMVYDNKGERYPKSIIKIPNNNYKSIHPTQKPIDLLCYLVRTYTNEGDTVLDNCSGSGTTAVACVKEKRHFICFEKDPVYWKKSVERVRNEMAQLTLF